MPAPPKRPSPSRSPELDEVSRRLGALALAHLTQDGHLSVRQREQLRRAFAAAGEALGWTDTPLDGKSANETARKDLLKMTKRGVKSMEQDLEAELAGKRKEVAQLEKIVAATRTMADDPDTEYETEITYVYTARDAGQSLVTKTQSVVVTDAQEAHSAADTIERSIPQREKLSDQMIIDLQERRRELEVLKGTLPDFVRLSHTLLRAVIANLE